MLFTDVQRSVRLNKKKQSTNTSPYPDEVIDRLARAFYPAILACWNSEEGQRSLVGARPLHLACARPFGRLKAPLGLSLLRCAAQTRARLGRQSRLIMPPAKKNRAFPTGNALLYISLSYVDFSGCVRLGAPYFCFIVVGCTSNRITVTPYRFLPASARTTRWRCPHRVLPLPDERTSNRVQHRASA